MQQGYYNLELFLAVSSSLILLMGSFIVTMLFFYKKRQNDYLNKLETLKLDYEKNLLNIQLEIQEQTFQNISREIHDNISLSLTLAKLNLNTINLSNQESSMRQINFSLEQITKAILDLSDISKSLNSEILANQGLIRVLEKEVEKIRAIHLFDLDFQIEGSPIFLESNKELIIFRIIQEGLNNIIKHARASAVQLGLNYRESSLDIYLADNGTGFCEREIVQNMEGRAGLNNISKRAKILDGRSSIKSEAGKGTAIFVTIPY